jgi:transcription-repair coupling factor (superfamily II helicase)
MLFMILDTLTSLFRDRKSITVSGLRGASPAWLSATVARQHTCCCIVPDEHLLSIFEQDLHLFTEKQVFLYPGHEIPPYTPLSPDQRTTAARLSTLYQLKEGAGGIVVTSIEALLRRVMPAHLLTSVAEYLMAGEDCDQDDLLRKLGYLGYDKVALVRSVGDFSVRGGIIDIYPPPFAIEATTLHEGPIRLDFFGNTIESLRSFDPFTQRSTGEISEATLLPVTDLLFDYSSPTSRKKLVRLFEQYGEEYQWNSDETARLMERMSSGRRFAGMEFFLPLFFQESGRAWNSPTSAFFPITRPPGTAPRRPCRRKCSFWPEKR